MNYGDDCNELVDVAQLYKVVNLYTVCSKCKKRWLQHVPGILVVALLPVEVP